MSRANSSQNTSHLMSGSCLSAHTFTTSPHDDALGVSLVFRPHLLGQETFTPKHRNMYGTHVRNKARGTTLAKRRRGYSPSPSLTCYALSQANNFAVDQLFSIWLTSASLFSWSSIFLNMNALVPASLIEQPTCQHSSLSSTTNRS